MGTQGGKRGVAREECDEVLATGRMGRAEDHGATHAGAGCERGLDLLRVDVEACGDDHAAFAPHEGERAVGVDAAKVAHGRPVPLAAKAGARLWVSGSRRWRGRRAQRWCRSAPCVRARPSARIERATWGKGWPTVSGGRGGAVRVVARQAQEAKLGRAVIFKERGGGESCARGGRGARGRAWHPAVVTLVTVGEGGMAGQRLQAGRGRRRGGVRRSREGCLRRGRRSGAGRGRRRHCRGFRQGRRASPRGPEGRGRGCGSGR